MQKIIMPLTMSQIYTSNKNIHFDKESYLIGLATCIKWNFNFSWKNIRDTLQSQQNNSPRGYKWFPISNISSQVV